MLVAREEVTIRERGSPPWAFALAQVRIRSADGQSQSVWIVMLVASGGRNGSHDTGVPSRGLAQELKQHLCSCSALLAMVGWFLWPRAQELANADQGKLDRLGSSTLTHKSAQQTQPRTGWTRRWLGLDTRLRFD